MRIERKPLVEQPISLLRKQFVLSTNNVLRKDDYDGLLAMNSVWNAVGKKCKAQLEKVENLSPRLIIRAEKSSRKSAFDNLAIELIELYVARIHRVYKAHDSVFETSIAVVKRIISNVFSLSNSELNKIVSLSLNEEVFDKLLVIGVKTNKAYELFNSIQEVMVEKVDTLRDNEALLRYDNLEIKTSLTLIITLCEQKFLNKDLCSVRQ